MTEERDIQPRDGELNLRDADCIERALTAPADAQLTDAQQEWREVWGAVPRWLKPVSPDPGTWGRVRAALCNGPGEAARVPLSAPANDRGWESAVSRWAAVLIVGLLVTATWLGNQVRIKDERIAQLQRQMHLSLAEPTSSVAVPAVSAAGFGFVTANGVESCTLEAQGSAEGARGWLFMGGAEPSCILAVEGLQPLADDQIYRAWFRSQGEAVPLGVVELVGDSGETFSQRIPPNIEAVFVTVERAGESATAPQGPTVLYGDAVVASL